MEMLQAQAAGNQAGYGLEDEQTILNDENLSESEKKDRLQKAMIMAASNGDAEKVTRLLGDKVRDYVSVDVPDEDGTPPLIYASCFVSLGFSFLSSPLPLFPSWYSD